MADLTQTATSVVSGTGAETMTKTAGETITAGAPVYVKAADGKVYLAQCDAATDDDVYGIALNGGAVNQPILVQRAGQINLGATVAAGTFYVLSAAAGKIAPAADLVATNFITVIGVGISTSLVQLLLTTTSAQIA